MVKPKMTGHPILPIEYIDWLITHLGEKAAVEILWRGPNFRSSSIEARIVKMDILLIFIMAWRGELNPCLKPSRAYLDDMRGFP